jgi:hypothetical protein
MSAREVPLTKKDLHAIRRFIDDDGVPRFTVGKVRDLTYRQAYDEIVRQTGCKTTEDPKGTSTWNREGIRRLGALNDAYFRAARAFISQKAIDRKVAKFNAEKKTANESQPTAAPERGEAAPIPEATPPADAESLPDSGGAQGLARESQRPEGHDARLDPGVRADLGSTPSPTGDAPSPQTDLRGDGERA